MMLTKGWQNIYSRATPGSFQCTSRNCTTCLYIEHGRNHYTFHSTGETYHIKSHITCTTFNVIYMIQFRLCNLQYIGETKRCQTVSMNIDDLYSTLLLIISIQRFRNTFSAITTLTPTCYLFLLKSLMMNAILLERHVRLTLFTRLRLLSL